jgi:hypothetical protein
LRKWLLGVAPCSTHCWTLQRKDVQELPFIAKSLTDQLEKITVMKAGVSGR